MSEITNVDISILKVHPRNTEFFDDISGEEYERFKRSIKEDGILSPILVSPDMTIISGHQRLKACKDLDFKLVPVMIRQDLIDEDDKLKKLLVANFGRCKNDPIKQGKVYKEYEKLSGIKIGNNQYNSLGNNSPSITQEQIAKELGIDVTTIRNLKRLQNLSPELQELISEGRITATTGYKVLTKLKQDEQEELFQKLNPNKKYTQNDIQEYINKNKALESRIIEISQEKNKTEIITQERDRPETTEMINKLRKELNEKSEEYQKLFNDLMQKQTLLNKTMGESTNWQLTSHCSEITKKMLDFVNEMAKYGYMAEAFNEIPIATRNEYLRCVKAVRKWTDNIIDEIENKNNYIEIEGE